jgi:hypothetical protein
MLPFLDFSGSKAGSMVRRDNSLGTTGLKCNFRHTLMNNSESVILTIKQIIVRK